MDHVIERGLFASRWLLAPMYVGLVGSLVILLYAFALELIQFAAAVPVMNTEIAVIGVLALIDLALAANLRLIVIL